MTKILVVGLLPGQVSHVTQSCRKLGVKLSFVGGRHNEGLRGHADHCVLTKFIDHGHADKARAQFPRERVHYTRGGLTELVKTIAVIARGAVVRGGQRGAHSLV